MTRAPARVRLAIACPGLDHVNRGYETFATQLLGALAESDRVDPIVIKGSGRATGRELPAWCLSRNGTELQHLAAALRRPSAAYEVEAASFVGPLLRRIRVERPDVVLTSDKPVAFGISWGRSIGRQPFRIVFSNGGPYRGPFPYADLVHHLTADALQTAADQGETDPDRAVRIPYGFDFPTAPPSTAAERTALRARLGLPVVGQIVVSVGALDMHHKRHEHLAAALAALPAPRPFLLVLGQRTAETAELLARVGDVLPLDGWTARTVDPAEVEPASRAADVFALASTTEGFPRAYAEAAALGLPCVVHDFPVAHEVLGPWGHYVDMRNGAAVTESLRRALQPRADGAAEAQAGWVRAQYSWAALAPAYEEMIVRAARITPRSGWALPTRR